MKVIVCEEIWVAEASDELIEFCKNRLVVPNPDFFKRLDAGRSVYGIPSKFQLYSQFGYMLGIPFGMSAELWRTGLLKGADVNVQFSPVRAQEYASDVRMYEFQERAVASMLDAKNGILESPCGSGKTTMGMEIIKRIGGRALWITHTSELLHQSKRTAERMFGTDGIGTITAGKICAGERITFATVQTLSRIKLEQFKTVWDIIIVDECHRVSGTPTQITMFYKVLSGLCARYKFGLTATPFRSDGLSVCMHAMIGELVHTVTGSDVAELVCPVRVERVPFDLYLPSSQIVGVDGTLNYASLIRGVVEHEERNEFLRQLIRWYHDMELNVLVLSERVAHLETMKDMIGRGTIVRSGKKNTDDSLLYATYALLSEGFDKPELDVLVLASPIKNERLVIQSCGRVARKSEGKKNGLIIDIRDSLGIFQGYGKQRDRIYKRLEYE